MPQSTVGPVEPPPEPSLSLHDPALVGPVMQPVVLVLDVESPLVEDDAVVVSAAVVDPCGVSEKHADIDSAATPNVRDETMALATYP